MADPLLVSVTEAARLMNISAGRARRMVAAGTMPGLVRLGARSQRVSVRLLQAWIDDQASAGAGGRHDQTAARP